MTSTLSKYFQPTSLTWWTGIGSLIAGLLLMLATVIPVLAPLSALAASFFPGQEGGALIVAGLGLIGIKGAISSSGVVTLNSVIDLVQAVKLQPVVVPVVVPATPPVV